jgi:hypothetical protein
LNLRTGPSTENQPGQYCVLVYRASGSEFSPLGDEAPVLLAHLSPDSGLSLFVNSRWHDIVAHEHQEYFRSLLEDFALRAKSDRGRLFQQITSLEVGPIVTRDVGQWDTRDDSVNALYSAFEKVK